MPCGSVIFGVKNAIDVDAQAPAFEGPDHRVFLHGDAADGVEVVSAVLRDFVGRDLDGEFVVEAFGDAGSEDLTSADYCRIFLP